PGGRGRTAVRQLAAEPRTLPEIAPASYGRPVRRYEVLAAQDRLFACSFTDSERTLADATVMNRMFRRLRREAGSWSSGRTSAELLRHIRAGCRHWLVVLSVPALAGAHDVMVAGFFGDLRPGMNHAAIYQLEAEVVARLRRYAGVR